jgi:nucleotide-binding universal stress UspA family protein
MTILCGTDLSASAGQAATVAALLARRSGEPLKLVHVAEVPSGALVEGGPLHTLYGSAPELLAAEAERLGRLGVQVQHEVREGVPDEVLVRSAEAEHAGLIVVASLGRRPPLRWLLGSVAERTAQTSSVPVLVVRDAPLLEMWLRGERPLRVMVAVDFSQTSKWALEWAASLSRLGPCKLMIAHVAWPPSEQARLGIREPLPPGGLPPELSRALHRELSDFIDGTIAEGAAQLLLTGGFGRPDSHLVQLAEAQHADLIVVGSHQRTGLSRLWAGSVSRGVLLNATTNIACVPLATSLEVPAPSIARFESVLIATDLTARGSVGIPFGYGLLGHGGTAYLAHVVPAVDVDASQRAATSEGAAASLRALAPADAPALGITTRLEMLEGEDVPELLCAAAERLGVDAICLGSSSMRLAPGYLGSVARRVLARTTRPVLVVRPPPV